jgi:RsiW-degrading membrane proteinase PrsW (M82 family)
VEVSSLEAAWRSPSCQRQPRTDRAVLPSCSWAWYSGHGGRDFGPVGGNQLSASQPSSARARSKVGLGFLGSLLPVRAWLQNPALRSGPLLLFLALICVPPFALVLQGTATNGSALRDAAWIFAAYFGVAWLLLIGVIVRPAHVTKPMLGLVVVVALITQVPLALGLENALHSNSAHLASSIVTIGLPEELAKALPVVVVVLLLRLQPRTPVDYLFLGAVSGLVFGASEVVHYFTLGIGGANEGATILSYIWRFVTDPINHACWAGLTGYFIGLAATGRFKWHHVGWVGLTMAAVLHGLTDWTPVNGHLAWVLVTLISAALFLGYAKVGATDQARASAGTATPGTAPLPSVVSPLSPSSPAAPAARQGQSGKATSGATGPQWWQATAAARSTARNQPPAALDHPSAAHSRAWWEQ